MVRAVSCIVRVLVFQKKHYYKDRSTEAVVCLGADAGAVDFAPRRDWECQKLDVASRFVSAHSSRGTGFHTQECSATVGVNFTIVIPETVRIRVDEDGKINGSLNNKQEPVYTKDENGLMTIPFP